MDADIIPATHSNIMRMVKGVTIVGYNALCSPSCMESYCKGWQQMFTVPHITPLYPLMW